MTTVRHKSSFPYSPEELFEFHADLGNLPRISPPLPRVAILGDPEPLGEGVVHVLDFSIGPIHKQWHARYVRVVPGSLIEDVQDAGPFRSWRHQHRFRAADDGSTLEDAVAFRMLPTTAGEFVEWLLFRPAFKGMFVYRHWRTRRLLANRR